ncbi:MAG: prepilin peptidase [Planctomycetota bacterium JB042]
MAHVLWIPVPVLLVAAYVDWRTHRVWDGHALALFGCAALFCATGWTTVGWLGALAGALVGLAVGGLAYRFLHLGGGDVGLLGGVGAILGVEPLLVCLFFTAVFGGGLAAVAWRRGEREVAYVPAIAAGYLAVLVVLAVAVDGAGNR